MTNAGETGIAVEDLDVNPALDAAGRAAAAIQAKLSEQSAARQKMAEAFAEKAETARQEMIKAARRELAKSSKQKLEAYKAVGERIAQAAAENTEFAKQEMARATSRTRRQIARNAKQVQKDLVRGAVAARKEAARAARAQYGTRRWPWLVALGGAVFVGYLLRASRPEGTSAFTPDAGSLSSNGSHKSEFAHS